MIRPFALAFILFLLLAAPSDPARADCLLTSNGEMRPAGALVHNTLHNVVQYCDGTIWKALVWKEQIPPDCPMTQGDWMDARTTWKALS